MNNDNINFFQTHGYCVVRSAVNIELIDFITQYALFDEMQDYTPDTDQVIGAHSKYADPCMETMLLNLHPLMEKNTGLELFPTYSFHRVYRPGDELVKHKDRPSCEISCTLSFNYNYENKTYNWPIYMDGKKVELTPGDLVIYRGCDLDHWRDKFEGADTDWHVQGFFHYVDKKGPNADWKFDKRKTVGVKSFTPNANNLQKHYITYTG
jgi:hypothetical protein